MSMLSRFDWPILIMVSITALVSGYRWLRVAQREHYEPGRVTAIAILWIRVRPVNAVVLVVAVVAAVWSLLDVWVALLACIVLLFWPLGMSFLPASGHLAVTPRLTRLVAVWLLVIFAAWAIAGSFGILVCALTGPLVWDLSLAITQPIERRLAQKFVRSARQKLKTIHPEIVAITGSYGKTSTKQYVAHLLGTSRITCASPASFNNLMGLSRTVNEHMTPRTEVFVAEMGTYGPGEITELCEVFPPEIAAITTIGEAHLERMGSRSEILRAKREITVDASTVVLNIDDPDLLLLADELSSAKTVVRCSTDIRSVSDVCVSASEEGTVLVSNDHVVTLHDLPVTAHAINVAVAVGIALAAGVQFALIERAVQSLPDTEHRATVSMASNGIIIVDDTFNANLPGALRALQGAAKLSGDDGHVWVVTPGLIELGRMQDERNTEFAQAVSRLPNASLVTVGRTNRSALLRGATKDGMEVMSFDKREHAVKTVMAKAREGDVVFYENDLPDQYP